MNNKQKKQGKDMKNKFNRLRDQPMSSIKKNTLYPPLSLPQSPPTIKEVMKLVEKLISKPKVARFPNSFIIYRSTYVKYLKDNGYKIPMTELSPMISRSWKAEPSFVKEIYVKISNEAEQLYYQTIKTNHPQNKSSLEEPPSITPQYPMDELNFPNNSLLYPPFTPISTWPYYPLENQFYQIDCINDVLSNQLTFPPTETQLFFSLDVNELSSVNFDIFNNNYSASSIENGAINNYFNF
ncbi:17511_t:CDS:1 [Acaulospora morrowiae]|uniref:17511_t:CDS:1 n=1 Tax=Acaulospora morrowiae TaxID=94023 RepID=A0A9N8VFV6_9GLOM|nr:17511_t:CDS:1 [Acaulospora morrowiae]